MPHDILTLYSAKAIEYGIAVVFLLLFVPFWRYVQGGVAAHAHATAHDSMKDLLSHWFRVPDGTFFHPGHAWARPDGDQLVTVGMDDFAQKLVGPVQQVQLPAVGARVAQGEPGWQVGAGSRLVDMLSPVGGTVVAVNSEALDHPETVNRDPYGDGWLMRIRAPRATAHLASLRAGALARRWMDDVCEQLTATLTPAVGLVSQDGGVPVDGIARAAAGANWDALARRFLLTDAAVESAPEGTEP